MEKVWRRRKVKESGNCIRYWEKGNDSIVIVDTREEDGDDIVVARVPSKEDFFVESTGDLPEEIFRKASVCAAVEHCVDTFGLIPKKSVWQDQETDKMYIAEHTYPHKLEWNHYMHPEDDNEKYIFCVDEENGEMWIPRRRFDNDEDLQMVSCGVY